MIESANTFPKIESKTHTLKVRGNNDSNNKLVPRTHNCDFCGKTFNLWLFSDIYLPMMTDGGTYRVAFGVSCCPECRKKRRKITALKGWSIALTVVCWVALFFGISSMVISWAKSPEYWMVFLVIPVFIASLIMLIKTIIPLYERIYAKKYSTKHPVEVVSHYHLWWQMQNKGWKINRIVEQNEKKSAGSIAKDSLFNVFLEVISKILGGG